MTTRSYKTREQWKAIIKDKEDNNLTIDQVCTMYNVSEVSYNRWVWVFKKEAENAPITEADIISLIERSIAEIDLELENIKTKRSDLADAEKIAIAKRAKLNESLQTLTGATLPTDAQHKESPTNTA